MQKSAVFSVILASFLGLLKIFSIIPFNRMAADDFSVAVEAKRGILSAISTTYLGGNGRFIATFIQAVSVTLTGPNAKIFMYSGITFTLLIIGLSILYKKLLNTNYKNINIYFLSFVSFVTLYLLTPNKTESWFWLTGSATYLWPIILFIFSVKYLFDKKFSKISFLLATLFAFVSAACNETFGFLEVFILISLFILSLKKERNYLILSMALASLISFFIMYKAPGNIIREQSVASNPMSLVGAVLYSLQLGPSHLYTLIASNIYFLLPLVGVLIYIFSKFTPKIDTQTALNRIFGVFISIVGLSILYMMPAFKVLGRIQPDRSDVSLSLIILFGAVSTAYYLSTLFSRYERNLLYNLIVFVFSVALTISAFSFTSNLASDFYIAKNYSEAYDAMVASFKQKSLEGDKKTIKVSLPPSGLIAITLSVMGKNDYKNQALSEFYGVGSIITE